MDLFFKVYLIVKKYFKVCIIVIKAFNHHFFHIS